MSNLDKRDFQEEHDEVNFGMMPAMPEVNPDVEQTDEGIGEALNPLDIDNPSHLTIIPKNISIESIIKRFEKGRINIMPSYQRKDNLWDNKKKSGLIESILLKIPIPAFYFDISNEEKWDVVDGLQRLSTIKHFVSGDSPLKLEGLEIAKKLNGKTYEMLDYTFKERIREYELTTFQILPGAPEQLKFELFKRLNTGGLALTPQEIRHALNQPIASNFIKECASLIEFKQAFEWKLKTDRMEDRDYVNRFFAFYLLDDIVNYKPDLDSFMNSAMKSLNKKSKSELEDLKITFASSMKSCWEIFGHNTFRKVTHSDYNRKQINKALYDTISINVAKSSSIIVDNLIKHKDSVLDELRDLHGDETFFNSLTSGTSDSSKVIYRHKKIKQLFDKYSSI